MAVTSFLASLQPLKEQEKPRAVPSPLPSCHSSSSKPDAQADTKAAQEKADTYLAEAEQTLARAHQAASELLEDAGIQAEALREAAWQEGFHNGKDAGRSAIHMELRKEHDVQTTLWRSEIDKLATAICAARQEMWDAQEAEMVAFVLDIARQVVKTEVTQNTQVVGAVLHNALRRVTDKDHVRIRVALPDAAGVRAMRDDLINLMDGVKNLEIVDDRRIGQGGCVVETNSGTIDARIETQMDEVERALTHATNH